MLTLITEIIGPITLKSTLLLLIWIGCGIMVRRKYKLGEETGIDTFNGMLLYVSIAFLAADIL
jgi:hypothetical protein